MSMLKRICSITASMVACLALVPALALAKPSNCETCHAKMTPKMVQDFNSGKMAKTLSCEACHGTAHTSEQDVAKAQLPTIATCQV